jgi:hypothetical protein
MMCDEGEGTRSSVLVRFAPTLLACAAVAAHAGCSLDWSHVAGDDADGPADADTADAPSEDASPDADADADSPADADGEVDDAPAETDAGCGDAGPCIDDNDPCNGTEQCNPDTGACERVGAPPDGTACLAGGGRCCGQVCRSGADCCSSDDCRSYCTGIPAPCSDFGDGPACTGQDGCRVGPGACEILGARNCNYIAQEYCADCGCAWDPATGGGLCIGDDLLACADLDELLCTNCSGCLWTAGAFSCIGTPTACDAIAVEPSCVGQSGCSWLRRTCNVSWICE